MYDTERFKALTSIVKRRVAPLNRASFKDNIHDELLPYQQLEEKGQIESIFWDRSLQSHNKRRIMSTLRNRFFYNWTHQGLMRGETLPKGRLNDMFSVHIPQDKTGGSQPYDVLCQIIDNGKTNDMGVTRSLARSCVTSTLKSAPLAP